MSDFSQLDVLLVEPSATQQRIIQQQLKHWEVNHITTLENGEAALSAMRMHKPDLVISAMYLSDMTGRDLVEKMRTEHDLQDVVFMLISSETNIHYLDPIRQAGVIAMLPKPFEQHQLHTALKSTLDFLEPERLSTEVFAPEELKVLIVDDSRTARRHICRVLENMGIEQIEEAENGIQALPLLQKNYFDFIVTDYNMPEMDGAQLVHTIRNGKHQASIPILMVTSEEDSSRLKAVRQSGVSALCDKPFDPVEVRSLIGQMLLAS